MADYSANFKLYVFKYGCRSPLASPPHEETEARTSRAAGSRFSDSDRITRLNAALEARYRIESELGEGGMATVV